MIVVDVNALAYLWLPGEFTSLAAQVLQKDKVWLSTLLWRSEFRNVLVQYLRRNLISRPLAEECLASAEAQMFGKEFLLPSGLVLDEVARSTCTAYDCEYVALARDRGVPLITADRQILREFPGIALGMEDFIKQ